MPTTTSTTVVIPPIKIDEFTRNVAINEMDWTVTGDGIFDELMETATKHLKAQFLGNRIREEDYADAYIQIYQATLQAALRIWLEKGLAEVQMETELAKLEIAREQLKLVAAQVESEDAKKALYRRQIEGFDEDYKYKLLKVVLDSWAVGFSVAKDSFQASGIPAPMTVTAINDLYNQYVIPDLDKYMYGREGVVTEETEGTT